MIAGTEPDLSRTGEWPRGMPDGSILLEVAGKSQEGVMGAEH